MKVRKKALTLAEMIITVTVMVVAVIGVIIFFGPAARLQSPPKTLERPLDSARDRAETTTTSAPVEHDWRRAAKFRPRLEAYLKSDGKARIACLRGSGRTRHYQTEDADPEYTVFAGEVVEVAGFAGTGLVPVIYWGRKTPWGHKSDEMPFSALFLWPTEELVLIDREDPYLIDSPALHRWRFDRDPISPPTTQALSQPVDPPVERSPQIGQGRFTGQIMWVEPLYSLSLSKSERCWVDYGGRFTLIREEANGKLRVMYGVSELVPSDSPAGHCPSGEPVLIWPSEWQKLLRFHGATPRPTSQEVDSQPAPE